MIMQKFLKGQRALTVARVAATAAVVAVFITLALVALDSRATAHHSQQLAKDATKALQDTRQTLLARCNDRVAKDKIIQDFLVSQQRVWTTFDELATKAPIPADLPPAVRKLYTQQRAAVAQAKADARIAATSGLLGHCDVFNQQK